MSYKTLKWLPIFVLAMLVFCLQSHIYLHRDVAYLIHTTKILLQGENYTQNIFEPSPPMILFLYTPAVLIAKWTSANLVDIFRIYFIFLAFSSIICCYHLLKKIFSDNNFILWFTINVLGVVLLFLPSYHFGQREHLLLILVFPYLFASVLHLNKVLIPPGFAYLIGIMGGLGFAIKPHFWPALILIELYFIIKKHSLIGWIRIESCMIACVILSYVASIFVFYPAYYQIIVPLWMPFYSSIATQLTTLLLYPALHFCLIVLALAFILRQSNRHANLSIVLSLAVTGFIISYLLGRVVWYYHIIPAMGIACVLGATLIGQVVGNIKSFRNFFMLLGFSLTLFAIPITFCILLLDPAMESYLRTKGIPRIAKLFNQYPNATFNYFSILHDYSIIELYSNAKYVGSFPYFQWEIIKHSLPTSNLHETRYKRYVLNKVIEDLDVRKPDFIIVDNNSFSGMFPNKAIDFSKEYSSFPQFAKAWEHYSYITTISGSQIYKRTH